jgi:hypothetical protein
MTRKAVFTDIMAVLERRIAAGDYVLKALPGERRLAEELGVSYMTARKAVTHLIQKEVLDRDENGCLIVRTRAGTQVEEQPTAVVLLVPAFPSPHLLACRSMIAKCVSERGGLFRAVEYVHWYDPVVREALDGNSGLIVIPNTEPIPLRLLREFAVPDRQVVFFDTDLTEAGLPCIELFPDRHIEKLLRLLSSAGRTRIDCLNSQGHNHEILRRIELWRTFCRTAGNSGTLWDAPAPAYGDPLGGGYRLMRSLLDRDGRPEVMLCTTQPAALGAIRACYDAGLVVGADISIATMNNEPTGWYFCPSLTGLEMPEVTDLIARCLDWFAKPGTPWSGPLRLEPRRARLLKGESTGSAGVARSRVGRTIR